MNKTKAGSISRKRMVVGIIVITLLMLLIGFGIFKVIEKLKTDEPSLSPELTTVTRLSIDE